MAKVSISEFSKTYGIDKKRLYKMSEQSEYSSFIYKDSGGHWVIDTSKSGAKNLIKSGCAVDNDPETKTVDRKDAVKKAREEKQIQAARLARIKADQEELKLGALSGKYIDFETVRYYFSFFQRGITDCFSGIKKVSRDLKRLYIAGKDREAEKKLLDELYICFANALKGLEEVIEKDR